MLRIYWIWQWFTVDTGTLSWPVQKADEKTPIPPCQFPAVWSTLERWYTWKKMKGPPYWAPGVRHTHTQFFLLFLYRREMRTAVIQIIMAANRKKEERRRERRGTKCRRTKLWKAWLEHKSECHRRKVGRGANLKSGQCFSFLSFFFLPSFFWMRVVLVRNPPEFSCQHDVSCLVKVPSRAVWWWWRC